MTNPIALDFTQAHQIIAQAGVEENTLMNQGQTVYNQQMALSQAATVAGNQDIQQANASNQKAAVQTQYATNEANIMATTGSSGTLYQQDLSAQNKIVGYNPQTLAHTQELQNQTIGTGKTAINQLENVQGGTRGLSAEGVQAKAQEITTQTNNTETQLGQSIQAQQMAATTASTQASNEATTQFKQEQQAQQSYKDAASQYISEASTYNQAAQTEYNSSSNYAKAATYNRDSFMIAALQVANIALDATQALTAKAFTALSQKLTGYITSNTAFTKSETVKQNQMNTYNQKEDNYAIQAKQSLSNNYKYS